MKEIKNFLSTNGYDFLEQEPLSRHTTFRIGGNADWFVRVKTVEQLSSLLNFLIERKEQFIILGWGSNVLISDEGIRGVVIKNEIKEVELLQNDSKAPAIELQNNRARLAQVDGKKRGLYEFKDLDYDESDKPQVKVRFSSGYDIPSAMKWAVDNEMTGLQWYAGIPGTIGGAVFNNIHGGAHLFEELVDEVCVIDSKTGLVKVLSKEDMKFAYDYSIIHETKDIIVSVVLNLRKGDVERAKFTATEWYKRKSVQPRNTPGCVWKNISEEDKVRNEFESVAIGYIIDQKLGWRGKKQHGQAIISANHANFIENLGDAKASDVLKLIKETKDEVKERYNIDLESEIIFLGFKSMDLGEILKDF